MAVKIIQGEDIDLSVNLAQGTQPYDLTGYTEITASFILTAGGCLDKTFTGGDITVTSDTRGEIVVALSDTDTDSLLSGVQSFEVLIDFGTKRRIAQLKSALNIVEKLCV